jgi:transcriptional repressor NrdR
MICPFCDIDDDKVIDSRSTEAGKVIRRRRQCLRCERRFTTYERVEQTTRLMVVKRDGTRVPFDLQNILRGVQAACGKRPISEEVKLKLAGEVEDELGRDFDREVPAEIIGERVMARLRAIDRVAYVRYASEYFQFELGEMREELEELDSRGPEVRDQGDLFRP